MDAKTLAKYHRYRCPQCSRSWARKVQTCLHCMCQTTPYEVDRKEQDIIAKTTVHTPSLLAPETPYTLALLKTKHGERFLKKSME